MGKRKAAEQIARTYTELAEALGMGGRDPERVLARLAKRSGFPGTPATPGQRDGELPVERIRAWLAGIGYGAVEADDEEIAELQRRITLLKLEQEERIRQEALGRLADVEVVGQYCAQLISTAKAIMVGIADEVVGLLPAGTEQTVAAAVHRNVERRIEGVLSELSRLAARDGDAASGGDLQPGVAAAGKSKSRRVGTGARKADGVRGRKGTVRPKRPAVVEGDPPGGE